MAYTDDLKDPGVELVRTAVVSPRNNSTGAIETYYFSSRQFVTSSTDTPAHTPFRARLKGFPGFREHLFSRGALGGRSSGPLNPIDLANGDGGLDFLNSRDYSWDGRSVVLKEDVVGTAYSAMQTVFTGTAKDVLVGDQFSIRLRSNQERLKVPVSPDRYRGIPVAFDFDGTDHVIVPSSVYAKSAGNVDHYSIEFWARKDPTSGLISGESCLLAFNLSTTATAQDHLAITLGGDTQPDGGLLNGEFQLDLDNAGTHDELRLDDEYRRNHLVDGLWHHFVVVVDAAQKLYMVYMDGVLVASATFTQAEPAFDLCTIGAYNLNNGTYQWQWEGQLSDVRFWSRLLSVEEIEARRFGPLDGDELGLEAEYLLDEGIDSSLGLPSNQANANEDEFYPLGAATQRFDVVFDSSSNERHAELATTDIGQFRQTGEGRANLRGTKKQLVAGEVFNAAPDLLDDRSLVYSTGHPIRVWRIVRDGGAVLARESFLDFDGVNDDVSIPDNAAYDIANTDHFALEAFVSLDVSGAGMQRIVAMVNSPAGVKWDLAKGGVFDIFFSELVSSAAENLNIDGIQKAVDLAKYWVGMYYDGTTQQVALLVNGDMVGADTVAVTGNFNANDPVYIGSERNAGAFLNGRVYDVRIWKGTAAQVNLTTLRANMWRKLAGDEAGLIGWWDFSDGSGATLTDQSPTGNNGTINGATWQAADYDELLRRGRLSVNVALTSSLRADIEGWLPFGYVPHFDGSTSHATIADDADFDLGAADDFSVRLWFTTENASSENQLIGKGDGDSTANVGWSLTLKNATTLELKLADASSAVAVTITPRANLDVRDGAPHMIGFTIDRTTGDVKLYDQWGLFQTSTPALPGDMSNADALYLGRDDGGALRHKGLLWGVEIWKEVRTEAQMSGQARKQPLYGVDGSIKGWWPLNEGDGSVGYDRVGRTVAAKNLTLNAITWKAGPWPSTTAEITEWLLGRYTDLTPAEMSFAQTRALDRLKPGVAGAVFRNETVEEALDILLEPGGWYQVDEDGSMRYGRLEPPEGRWIKRFTAEGTTSLQFPDHASYDFDELTQAGWTIETRVRIDGLGSAEQMIVDKEGNYSLRVLATGPTVRCDFVLSTNNAVRVDYTLAAAEIGAEIALAATYNTARGEAKIFVNSVEKAASTTTTAITRDLTNPLTLGYRPSATYINGYLSEVRMFSKELVAGDLSTRQSYRLSGDEADLVAYIPLDEGLNQTPHDDGPADQDASTDTAEWAYITNPDLPLYRNVEVTVGSKVEYLTSGVMTTHNLLYTSIRPLAVDVPTDKVVVHHTRNHNPHTLDDLVGLVTQRPTAVTQLTQPWAAVEEATPEAARGNHLIPSQPGPWNSPLQRVADARVEAKKQGGLWGLERQRFLITGPRSLSLVKPGEEFRVKSHRYGIGTAGRNFVCISRERRPNSAVVLEAFG